MLRTRPPSRDLLTHPPGMSRGPRCCVAPSLRTAPPPAHPPTHHPPGMSQGPRCASRSQSPTQSQSWRVSEHTSVGVFHKCGDLHTSVGMLQRTRVRLGKASICPQPPTPTAEWADAQPCSARPLIILPPLPLSPSSPPSPPAPHLIQQHLPGQPTVLQPLRLRAVRQAHPQLSSGLQRHHRHAVEVQGEPEKGRGYRGEEGRRVSV